MKIKDLISDYLKYMKTLNRSYYTIRDARFVLKSFVCFLEMQKVYTVTDLTRETIEDYQQELAFSLTAKGKPLAIRTQTKRLGTVRGFTRYLKDHDYLAHDPGEKIKLPKDPKPLPRIILTPEEIKKLMAAPDIHTNLGYRNRIVLEILYDTAVRRLELSNIRLTDLDLDGGYIRILGKGNKDRVVPASERVCSLIKNYLLFVRPSFVTGKDPGYLILNRWGDKMDPNGVWAIVKRCVRLAGLKKNISTHSMRHTCASHMLKNKAPIRYIQEFLGHESLNTTQIYTRVTINDLKEIHAKYHPGNTEE